MDTVTHGLAGWLVARAIPMERGRKEATAAVVIGSVLPDADNIASLFGSELYLRIHRGLSHSFAGIAVSSVFLALILYRFGKWKDWKKLYLLALLGQLSHIALDLLNSYGTQVLQPFSDARMSFDLLFIVDLAFTGIVVLGILLSRCRPSRARAALAVLCAYVGLAALLHARADGIVREAAERHGVKVVSSYALPRLGHAPDLSGLGFARRVEAAVETVRRDGGGDRSLPSGVAGFPLPAGPFAWNGFVDDGTTYLRAEVDPVDGSLSWRERVWRGADVAEVRAVREIPDVRTYLWFARFPTVYVTTSSGRTVLAFSDLRFGGMSLRRGGPFRLKVVEEPGRPPQARWGDP